MKEIPFIRHHPLIPLPSSSGGGGGGNGIGGGGGTNKARQFRASVNHANDDGGDGAIGVALTEVGGSSNNTDAAVSYSTALVAVDENNGGDNVNVPTAATQQQSRPFNYSNVEPQEESYALRGLSSIHYSKSDNRIISTHGVSGRRGVICISVRDAGDDNGAARGHPSNGNGPRDVEVDLSSLMDQKYNGSNLFESNIVGTAAVVTHSPSSGSGGEGSEGNTDAQDVDMDSSSAGGKSCLHLRTVDPYGTVLSLSFSYPDMTPTDGSFLLPLSPTGGHQLLRPHPGASIENNQVCFPTSSTVVFALNPHLYCVDLGSTIGGSSKVATRVWTNIHHITSDPITDNSGRGGIHATPTPKKPRKSLGSILSKATYTLMGMSDYEVGEEYEYPDDQGEDAEQGGYGGSVGMIPSIAALANLSNNVVVGSDDIIARVATLHSDGSLRVWVAEHSRKESTENQLRIPSVQRVAISQNNNTWTTSEVTYTDPSIPSPSMWDPCRDALTLRGKYTFDSQSKTSLYEVALYVQCYANGKDRESGSVYVFQGSIVGATGSLNDDTRALPSGDTAKMQTLALPNGTTSVVDVSWSAKRDLMVLLRHATGRSTSETLYEVGEERDVKVSLAVYPFDQTRSSSYATEAILPSNTTLPYLEFNHFGYEFGLSAEEELDRYLCLSDVENSHDDGESQEMETQASPSASAASIAKAEAQVDKAGLLAILQPFGRNRPSALAVRCAMSSLKLLDDGDVSSDAEIRPVTILSGMRKWKKRAVFQTSSTSNISALVLFEDSEENDSVNSPMASDSLSIYHAFASATKSKRNTIPSLDTKEDDGQHKLTSGVNKVESAQQSHRWKWIRLLSEIRLQESQLDGLISLGISPGNSFLVRGSMISILSFDDDDDSMATGRQEGGLMAGLDELAMGLLQCIMSNPDLGQLLSKVESMLYDGTSKASSLVNGWSDKISDIELLTQVELLGNAAMMRLALTEGQLGLLSELSQLSPNTAEDWLKTPLSASSSISTRLAISKRVVATLPNYAATSGRQGSCESDDTLFSASSLIASRLESIRLLSLSRLLLVFGSPQKNPPSTHGALRSILYCSALSWAIHQPSRVEKDRTVLEEHLSRQEMTAALPLADAFVASAFSYHANETTGRGDLLSYLISPSHEPRVALRLLAPLVEFSSQSDATSSTINTERKESAAECLLAEAAMIAKKNTNSAVDETTSPELLWRLASKLLPGGTFGGTMADLINRVSTLERHLNSIEDDDKTSLPLCCSVILEAVQDAISAVTSSSNRPPEMNEIPKLCEIAFQTCMRGHLWDEALRECISNPSVDQRKANLKRLILGMVDAGAPGKIVDMSLTVVGLELSTSMLEHQEVGTDDTATGVDLFDLASKIIEEAAIEQATVSLLSEPGDVESVLHDSPNYWSCLYALHASRGNWRQAAYAMDMCGKAAANSVSSSKSDSQTPFVLSKAASKKIMDEASRSAQACVHAVSLVDKPSHRYLLPPGNQDISSEARLLTQGDLDRRATRALALRMFGMDEYSPDSVGSILESTSRDTIDSLARFGYYDQAIAVASGVSSKRKGCLPGGVDLFEDALRYILCTHIVPAATMSHRTNDDGGLESLQSRSKIAQIRASSSACVLGSANVPPQSRVKSWGSNGQSGKALQSTMAMDLLQQYTTVYSNTCRGLGLNVANAILRIGNGVTQLPLWLKELCMFGIPGDGESKSGLFAQPAGKDNRISDPAGLMRLYIKHNQYGEACDVVTSILSKQASSTNASTRLPEKGSIDYVPYDLIDMLWNMIDSVIATNSSNSSDDVKSQVKSLIRRRACMEQALEKHFESLKTSEEGLMSARRVSSA